VLPTTAVTASETLPWSICALFFLAAFGFFVILVFFVVDLRVFTAFFVVSFTANSLKKRGTCGPKRLLKVSQTKGVAPDTSGRK